MDWLMTPFREYRDFSGRSPRRIFWLFHLFLTIVSLIAGMIDVALGMGTAILGMWGPLSLLTMAIFLSPSLALMVRRLHDIDRSGWWLLLGLLPAVSAVLASRGFPAAGLLGLPSLVLLVFWALDGTRGPNRFGADPKARTSAAVAG
jgi:uncharacterized membrane protein YhaH (DUF805 family)